MNKIRKYGPVWFIEGENHGRYPYCHSIYIYGAGVLIDPGSDRRLLMELRENYGVNMIWLTHSHEDHFMHLDIFDDVPLWTAEQEAPPLLGLEAFLDCYGIDNPAYRRYWRSELTNKFNYKPRKPTYYLRNGETFNLGRVTAEVILTPGHTPGHLAFFFKEPGVLFMGDYDLTKFGPFYGDRHSSIEDTIVSVEHLRSIPAAVWLTSHESGVFEKEPGELWDRYLSVIRERQEKLLTFLNKPRTLQEIVEAWIIYRRPREPEAFYKFAEEALIKKHLKKMVLEGALSEIDDRYTKISY